MANNINKFLDKAGLTRLISWIKGALNSKQDVLTFDSAPTASSTNPVTSGGIATALNNKQDKLTFDSTPTTNSSNPVTSGGVKAAIDALGTPNEIASITTQESSASGGNNVVTITDTDGTVTSFNVKNGKDGQNGADGADGVSLGEIALVQTTGDSEESVMSQKAVTEQVERVSIEELENIDNFAAKTLPEGYTALAYIDSGTAGSAAVIDTGLVPSDENWRFTGSWLAKGFSASYASIISAYSAEAENTYRIIRFANNNSQMYVGAYQRANACTAISGFALNTWYSFDLKKGTAVFSLGRTSTHTLGTVTGTTSASTMKIGNVNSSLLIGEFMAYHNDELVAHLITCKRGNAVGMYDIVREQFFTSNTASEWIASETHASNRLIDGKGLASLISQETGDSVSKVMSQAEVTRELQIAPYIYRTPTYLQGRLCYYKLDDYPQLDPRTADGISIAFNANNTTTAKCMMFAILNPNASINQGFATRYFGLTSWDGAFRFGFFSSYGSITTGGYSFEKIRGHYVITYNFKTGVCKCYRNGVLSYTQTPSDWDEQSIVRDYFSNCTHITLNVPSHSSGIKQSGIALFGRELTEQAVEDLYGNGADTIRTKLISNNLKAYNLCPIYPSWQIQVFSKYATTSTATDGGINITQKGSAENNWQQFGFKGLSGFINNATLEFDFELIGGSIKYVGGTYDRTWHGNSTSNYYAKNVYTITDENENDVTYSDLEMGHVYHVVANPDFIASGTINSNGDLNHFIFSGCSTDCIIHIKPILKVTEHGAALECSINTYAGTYWELANGIKLPLNTTTYIYSTESLYIGTDIYISNVVKYSSSIAPQFNGQIAVDTVNGKVYIGYLTSAGGTWKQVSN